MKTPSTPATGHRPPHPVPAPAAHGNEEVERLLKQTFGSGRDPRSEPYKRGVRAIFKYKLLGKPLPQLPFVLGTAEADAYFSGQNEGRAICWRVKESEQS